MVTHEQSLAFAGSAAQLTAINLGLDQTPVSQWTQDQHIAYVRALANKILQYPADFDAQLLNSAAVILGQNFDGMALDDFVNSAPGGGASVAKIGLDSFGDALLGTAGSFAQAPASLGMGAVNLVNKIASTASNLGDAADRLAAAAADTSHSFSWLLPVGLIALVAILALNTEERYERKIRGALA